MALWVATIYLLGDGGNRLWSLFTGIPASIMTAVVVTYILAEPKIALGNFIPMGVAYAIGGGLTLALFGFYLLVTLPPVTWAIHSPKAPKEENQPIEENKEQQAEEQ